MALSYFLSKNTSRNSPTSEALRRKDFAIIFDWFKTYFFWGAVIGFVFIAIAASQAKELGMFRVVGLSLIFAGGCTVCGWVLGLLFGIPRTLSRPHPIAGTVGSSANGDLTTTTTVPSRVNTNLEDVSDWLTKTLVGVGLTQLYFVPHYIWRSAGKINQAGFMWDGSGQLLALALFLYFAPGGFWLGYIGTRTILTKLFDSLEGPLDSTVETALAPDALPINYKGRINYYRTVETESADAAILAYPMTKMNTSRELAAWGAAKARSQDMESATVALQQAVRADPSDQLVKQTLAKIYTSQNRKPEAQRLLLNDQISEVAMFNALYEETPAGFTKALKIGARIATQPGADNNLNLHVWMACAYGQQHRDAVLREDRQEAAIARDNVVKEVEAAVRISPAEAKPLLRSFWLSSTEDDDLRSIPNDDEDLMRLLLP